jgi:hypothetical protein
VDWGCTGIVNVYPAFGPAKAGRLAAKHSRERRRYRKRRSHDELYNIIYFQDYHLTTISLYGFHRKQGANTRIRGNKLRLSASWFQGRKL